MARMLNCNKKTKTFAIPWESGWAGLSVVNTVYLGSLPETEALRSTTMDDVRTGSVVVDAMADDNGDEVVEVVVLVDAVVVVLASTNRHKEQLWNLN